MKTKFLLQSMRGKKIIQLKRHSKGMSQIMYLVIAASVLLATAVVLIFMFTGGVPESVDDAENTQIRASCDAELSVDRVSDRCYEYYDIDPDADDANEQLADELGVDYEG